MSDPTDSLAFKEALNANTKALEALHVDFREDRKLLHDVRERVIRIESNRVDGRVLALEADMAALKADKFIRQGTIGAWNWIGKNITSLAAVFVALVASAVIILKATGRLP